VPALDLQDLRYCLAAGEPAEAIADFLCRDVDEVRAKIDERPRSAWRAAFDAWKKRILSMSAATGVGSQR
jgi:hypothetical protein